VQVNKFYYSQIGGVESVVRAIGEGIAETTRGIALTWLPQFPVVGETESDTMA